MGVIKLSEALKEMQSGNLFSIRYVTADKSRNSGGDIKEYDGCRLSRRAASDTEAPVFTTGNPTKRPNHYRNRTRNIVLANSDVRKVNVWLIIGFNGKPVILY